MRSKSIFDILITGKSMSAYAYLSCDLRSKSIFDILITGLDGLNKPKTVLWFALKKYLWHPDYRFKRVEGGKAWLWFALKKYLWHPDYRSTFSWALSIAVVICAQKVSLTSWLQECESMCRNGPCCDLRSKSIFDILITGFSRLFDPAWVLWFALKKYLWHPDYRSTVKRSPQLPVVICAQKVSLTSWLQVAVNVVQRPYSCDLRSKSIFDILITG